METVLYDPEGRIVQDPLYTFTLQDRNRNPGFETEGGPEYGGFEGDQNEEEPFYPPVEPYAESRRFIEAKLSRG